MNMEEIYWIWLTLIKGIGPIGAHKLISEYKTAENIYYNRKDIVINNKAIDSEESFASAQKIYEECERKKIQVVTYESDLYRELWKAWTDFPLLLYLKGNTTILKDNGVGIVGSRRCTPTAKQKAIDIATEAVSDNKTVISGMAKGVDSYAHTAAIKGGGATIAVLGTGVDVCYPKEHYKLYEALCENGAVISEYIPGVEPQRYNFPRRNRIIAGLSDILYVVEAGERSGTVFTVQAANKYDKLVVMK